MAGAFKTASDTPIQLLNVVIIAADQNLGESLKRMMDKSEIIQCAGIIHNPDDLRTIAADEKIQAVLLDHPPSPEEKIASQFLGLPLALLDDDATQKTPEPSVCARFHKNFANAASLEMLLSRALETHAYIRDLEEAYFRMNYLKENRETAGRLGDIISMIGVAAHEVNQPLTSLLGHLELINMNRDDAEKVLSYIERVDESGERIAHIVKDIQDLRHEQWINDGAFEHDERTLNVLYAGENRDLFDHIRRTLAPYPKIRCTKAEDGQIPVETDIVLAEYAPGTDWESWSEAARKEEKVIGLTAEYKDLPAACKWTDQNKADGVLAAWAPESVCLQTLTQVCEIAYFRKKAENARLRLRKTALKDDLTSLVSEAIMKRAVTKEIPRSEKMNRTSSLAAVHVEGMEEILKNIGPKGLDHAVLFVGRCLRRNSHREDLPARILGGQFLVLLPGRDKHEALDWFKSLEESIQQTPFDWFGKKVEIRTTAGIAEHQGGRPETCEDWMDRACLALDQAKAQGPGSVLTLD